MKPLNLYEPGCNYTTSNCVIWQGPDLLCIDLCKGDTISDVIFKLATELCGILDLTNYDVSCFETAPTDFNELMQTIIDLVCTPPVQAFNTELVSRTTNKISSEMVSIAPMFYYTVPKTGDRVTHLPIVEYAMLLGNTISEKIAIITQVQRTVTEQAKRIEYLEMVTKEQGLEILTLKTINERIDYLELTINKINNSNNTRPGDVSAEIKTS